MLAMVLYPEAQRKAQEELDAVVGRSRPPTFDDLDSLVYIHAIVKEILRWHPVDPLGACSISIDSLHRCSPSLGMQHRSTEASEFSACRPCILAHGDPRQLGRRLQGVLHPEGNHLHCECLVGCYCVDSEDMSPYNAHRAINRDPDLWGLDADKFKPERHIGLDGKLAPSPPDTKDEGHVSFGFGRR